ncbi:glycoside hydrolase family protein [Sinorhizobium medicae]|uniref:glycoside hydrolase family protein n=1 Tax=Sinorhizobium medicae TaxID=110321 RepID=UPI0011AA3C4C|nr:peptidoglycan-binding protein [Sinorhizobium medicae]MDX0870586.1 glycoside hydrolase family protein [Sinorhizobium medicae]MDX0949176.1 glycoside hydrolase family protein [Sinorhizobium medicae]MDX0986354.1 glycoside hydrolase family protein [Sinorhizobium medicae]MDX1053245.1 glycoside hydrolase family protein [Sinorhizobium medicae]MDX1170192.1 glycoside hydrolase family protein [Sinorhizobium medicae]
MTITTTSDRGRAFMRGHEGNPLTCYLDPVGVPTIGTGFTMRSAAVRKALTRLGITKLVPGKTKITAVQSDAIFAAVLAEEFEPAVVASSPKSRTQHQMDAAVSAIYNLGAGAMEWTWADLWRAGKVKEAAAYLGSHYNTADGKKLPGLVRRRKEESELFLNGRYATGNAVKEATPNPPRKPDAVVKEAQEILTSKGFNPGAIDGWMGEKTREAIIAYQKAHPHLEADGILGPATLSQLRRDAKALREAATKGVGSAIGSGALAFMAGLPWGWIAAAVAVLAVGYVVYRYRDVLQRHWNSWRGEEVRV